MANISDINTAILKGYAYALELGEELAEEQDNGCIDCYDASKIECILWLAETLQHWVDNNQLGKDTDELYTQLVDATDDFTGDVPDVDENASIPHTTLINGYSRWGFIIGNIEEQTDLMNLLAQKADIGDGLITPVTVNIVGEEAVVTVVEGAEIVWKIGSSIVSVGSPQIFPINPATDNYFRKDIIVLSATSMDYIEGVESQSAAIAPNVPVGSVLLVPIDIYGDIINSGGVNPPVDIAVPSWTVYGSVPFGKYTNGQTVPAAPSAFDQYREAWTNIAPPTYLVPQANLTSTPSPTGLEIGQSVNVSLSLAFNQRDGGAETSRVINKNGSPLSGTTDTITISSAPIVYQGSISYAQGAVKNNAAGIPDPTGRINAGTVNSGSISYSGIYPYFYLKSSSPITASDMQTAIASGTAIKVIGASTGTLNIPYAPNGEYMAVAYPATSATKTRWFVSLLSQGDIPGGVFGGQTTLAVNSPDGRWSGINYKIHVTPVLTNTSASIIELRNS